MLYRFRGTHISLTEVTLDIAFRSDRQMNPPHPKVSFIIEARVLAHNISINADLLYDIKAIWEGVLDTLFQDLIAPPLVLGLPGSRFP
jgi:hypothetical protein